MVGVDEGVWGSKVVVVHVQYWQGSKPHQSEDCGDGSRGGREGGGLTREGPVLAGRECGGPSGQTGHKRWGSTGLDYLSLNREQSPGVISSRIRSGRAKGRVSLGGDAVGHTRGRGGVYKADRNSRTNGTVD